MLGVKSKRVTSLPLNIIKRGTYIKKREREKLVERGLLVAALTVTVGRLCSKSSEPSELGLNSFPSSVQLCVNREQW